MKLKRLPATLFLVFFGLSTSLSAQSCLPQGIDFDNQQAIDDFPLNYPGCKHIEGFVQIHNGTGVVSNLEGLSQLESTGDGLRIVGTSITSFTGLGNLKTVEGDLSIQNNAALISLDSLTSLESVGGLNILHSQPTLKLTGMDKLEQINGDVFILGNTLPNLIGINLPPIIKGNLEIRSNDFINMKGLENIEIIGNDLIIDENFELVDLTGFDKLKKINDKLRIVQNYSMESLNGLVALETVNSFSFSSNSSLTNFKGMESLHSIKNDFIISNNHNLTTLEGLDQLSFVGNSFKITNNHNLINLQGLKSYNSTAGLENLIIEHNENLVDLNGLLDTDIIGLQSFIIKNNQSLDYCHIQPLCNYLSNCGIITSIDNPFPCNSQASIEKACERESSDFNILCKVELYPNPVDDLLHINIFSPKTTAADYEIFDQMGRKLLEGKNVNEPIDVIKLSAGVYNIKINHWDFTTVKRFVKN